MLADDHPCLGGGCGPDDAGDRRDTWDESPTLVAAIRRRLIAAMEHAGDLSSTTAATIRAILLSIDPFNYFHQTPTLT